MGFGFIKIFEIWGFEFLVLGLVLGFGFSPQKALDVCGGPDPQLEDGSSHPHRYIAWLAHPPMQRCHLAPHRPALLRLRPPSSHRQQVSWVSPFFNSTPLSKVLTWHYGAADRCKLEGGRVWGRRGERRGELEEALLSGSPSLAQPPKHQRGLWGWKGGPL